MQRDVRLRHHPATATTTIDHGHAADLVVFESGTAVLKTRVQRGCDDGARHDLADGRLWRSAFGDRATRDVTISHYANRVSARIHDRDLATVVLRHQPGNVPQRCVRGTANRVWSHDLSHQHGLFSSSRPP